MFWKIFPLVLACLFLIFCVWQALIEIRQKRGISTRFYAFVVLALASLVGIFPLIQQLQPSEIKPIAEGQEVIKEMIRELPGRIGEPTRYVDGIPQSENLNLRELFAEGVKRLNNYKYDEAIKAFRAGLALQDIEPSEAAALLIHIAIAHGDQNKWDEAEGAFKEALHWAEMGKDEEGQAAALVNLALVYFYKRELDTAIVFCDSSLQLSENVDHKGGVGIIFITLGMIYIVKEQWHMAVKFHDKALKVFKDVGDELGIAKTHNNLGVLYSVKGEWGKAFGFFNEAQKRYQTIFEETGDEYGIAETKGNIGVLYKKQAKEDEARRLLEESLEIFERIGHWSNAEMIRKHLEDL